MSEMTKEATSPVIELRDVTKRFGQTTAMSKITYSVQPGTIFALLGENGAGKTTTIKILLGLTRPDEGSVRVLGLDPTKSADALEIRRRVGYVPDTPAVYDWMTVGEMGKFSASFQKDRKGYWSEFLRLIESFELTPGALISSLSKGMKAELSLSLALASDPELLILDEPTGGLDVMTRRRFIESMAERAASGKTVFLSSHQITDVERVADQVVIMRKSALLYDEPLDVLKGKTRTVYLTFDENLEGNDQLTRMTETLFTEPLTKRVDGRTLIVTGRDLFPDIEAKLERIGELFGMTLLHSEIRQPTLEEIFVTVEEGER